jgi:hypothetical protein
MFFTVRAVGQHTLKITLYGPLNEVVCLVKKVIEHSKFPVAGDEFRVCNMLNSTICGIPLSLLHEPGTAPFTCTYLNP